MQINACIELNYIELLTCSLLRINELYIVLTIVLHFHGTELCEDFTPMILVEDNWYIPFTEIIGKCVLSIAYVLYK